MIEMNPYYARESDVGPVFDVATFSPGRALAMGISGLVFAVLVGGATLYVWNPAWIMPRPPKALVEANREIGKWWRDHPQGTEIGVGGAGLVAAFFAVAACSYLYQSMTREMYFRVGEGGISFRVPQGFGTLALDLTWDEVVKLTVTQKKRLGSLSPNAGNIGGYFTLRTRSHGKHFVPLDDFREPAHLIYKRIGEARQTRPAELAMSSVTVAVGPESQISAENRCFPHRRENASFPRKIWELSAAGRRLRGVGSHFIPAPSFEQRSLIMSRYLTFLASALVVLAAGSLAAAKSPTIVIRVEKPAVKPDVATKPPFHGKRPTVDVAILLDTSNSMDGLIHQAKSQLWTIVQQFAKAKKHGQTPVLRVALFEYGNLGLPASEGYIRQVVPLTDDLDKLSEALFALATNGGDEYCGQVIDVAVKALDWSQEPNGYKAIFIAGNEPFTQGPVDYRQACKQAIERGIVVNTIHCGNSDEGRRGKWQDGAKLAEGESFNIDQDRAVVQIRCPQDEIIIKLNTELNKTYLWYGTKHERLRYYENQVGPGPKRGRLGRRRRRIAGQRQVWPRLRE